mmetsp:Transcript_54473/g.162256  ORF Transcript_54473/g.162256 Transcript_54473/m.162256 type:complete len:383 (+) Transcript_54473:204-1352(+)
MLKRGWHCLRLLACSGLHHWRRPRRGCIGQRPGGARPQTGHAGLGRRIAELRGRAALSGREPEVLVQVLGPEVNYFETVTETIGVLDGHPVTVSSRDPGPQPLAVAPRVDLELCTHGEAKGGRARQCCTRGTAAVRGRTVRRSMGRTHSRRGLRSSAMRHRRLGRHAGMPLAAALWVAGCLRRGAIQRRWATQPPRRRRRERHVAASGLGFQLARGHSCKAGRGRGRHGHHNGGSRCGGGHHGRAGPCGSNGHDGRARPHGAGDHSGAGRHGGVGRLGCGRGGRNGRDCYGGCRGDSRRGCRGGHHGDCGCLLHWGRLLLLLRVRQPDAEFHKALLLEVSEQRPGAGVGDLGVGNGHRGLPYKEVQCPIDSKDGHLQELLPG